MCVKLLIMGRPSTFSHARADEICKRLAAGESLRHLCLSDDMPTFQTVFNWLDRYPPFFEQYTRARNTGLEVMAEHCLDIADDATNDWATDLDGHPVVDQEHINRSRLRVETRKWYLSKLAPKRYGDQQAAAGGAGAVQINLVVLPAGADAAAGSLDLRAMIRGGEVRALPAPGGDDASSD